MARENVSDSEIDKILDDDQSEVDDSDAGPNFEINSSHDSNSEISGDEKKDEPSLSFECQPSTSTDAPLVDFCATDSGTSLPRFYKGRNETTKWRKTYFSQSVRTRKHNIVTMHLHGNIRAAMNVHSPLESWLLFFSKPLIDLVLESTNIYIDSVRNNYRSDHNMARPLSFEELKAYFGLLYLAGLLHGGKMNIEDFWNTDGTGIEIFRATMSLKRFRFLTRCIRFDNIHTREVRKLQDNLAAIRNLLDMFVSNCNKYYAPSENVTLDEMLVPYRGRCRFRMYIPNKPAKYGIKVYILACSKTNYVKNLEVYAGAQPDGPYRISNKADDVVLRLIEPVKGSGRNLTIDNWFNSYSIVKKLKEEMNLTVVGTLKKNKPQIPADFLPKKSKKQYSSMFGFQEDITLVSYVPKRNKAVLLFSSMHHDDEIDIDSGEKKKPSIITYYNQTKGGVDVVDAMCGEYSVARGTRRWPLCLFFQLLNIAALNGYIVLKANQHVSIRREYIRNLGKSLIQPYMAIRAAQPNLQREIRRLASYLSGTQERKIVDDPQPGKRGRCYKCKDNKTKYFCKVCKVWLCLTHAEMVCTDCFEN